MIYAVSQTETFERTAEKFFKKHKDLLPKFAELTEKLSENPFEKSLKTHKLKGELSSYYACSLAYDYRVIVTIVIKDKVITLMDIGALLLLNVFRYIFEVFIVKPRFFHRFF